MRLMNRAKQTSAYNATKIRSVETRIIKLAMILHLVLVIHAAPSLQPVPANVPATFASLPYMTTASIEGQGNTFWAYHTMGKLQLLTNDQRVLGNITITSNAQFNIGLPDLYELMLAVSDTEYIFTGFSDAHSYVKLQTGPMVNNLPTYAQKSVDNGRCNAGPQDAYCKVQTEMFLVSSGVLITNTTYALFFKTDANPENAADAYVGAISDLHHLRMDLTTKSTTIFNSDLPPQQGSQIIYPFMMTSDALIAIFNVFNSAASGTVIIMNPITGTTQQILDTSRGNINPKMGVLDNLTQRKYFVIIEQPSILLKTLAVDETRSTSLVETSSLIIPDSNMLFTNILNMGSFEYIAMTRHIDATTRVLQLINKLNPTTLDSTLSLSLPMFGSISPMTVGESRDNIVYLSYLNGNYPLSMSVYSILFNPCESIDGKSVVYSEVKGIDHVYPFMAITCQQSRCPYTRFGCPKLEIVDTKVTKEGSIFTFSSQLAPRITPVPTLYISPPSQSPQYSLLPPSAYSLSILSSSIQIKITSPPFNIHNGYLCKLVLAPQSIRNQDYSVPYADSTILFTYTPPPSTPSLSPSTLSTLSTSSTIISTTPILLVSMNPFIAFLLSTILANYTYLALVDGPLLPFSGKVLAVIQMLRGGKGYMQSIIDDRIGENVNCLSPLPAVYTWNMLDCNYLKNSGGECLTLVLALLVASLIYLLDRLCLPKSTPADSPRPIPEAPPQPQQTSPQQHTEIRIVPRGNNPDVAQPASITDISTIIEGIDQQVERGKKDGACRRIGMVVVNNYSYKYPLMMMYTGCLPLLILAFGHLRYGGAEDAGLTIGWIVSAIMILTCAGIFSALIYASNVLKGRKELGVERDLPCRYFYSIIEGMHMPLQWKVLIMPAVGVGRAFAIALILTIVSDRATLQISMLIGVELLYLLPLCLIRTDTNHIHRLFGIVMIAFNIVYLSIKLISTVGNVDWVDGVLGWMLVGFFCLCILYTICLALYALNSLCKSKGKQPESSKSPEKKYQEKLPSSLTTVSTYRELSKMYEGNMDLSTSRLG
jgi:hypothetical protein